jgi:hypothetical protein
MRQLKTKIDNDEVTLEKFIITKGLTKDPKDVGSASAVVTSMCLMFRVAT